MEKRIQVVVGFEARKDQMVDFTWKRFSVIATFVAALFIMAVIGFRADAIVDAITYYPV